MPGGSFGARYGESVAYDPNLQAIVLFGGRAGGPAFNAYCGMWRWTGAAWTAVTPAHLPPGRSFAGIFLDPQTNHLGSQDRDRLGR